MQYRKQNRVTLQADVYTANAANCNFPGSEISAYYTISIQSGKLRPEDPSRDSSRSPQKISGFALLFFILLEKTSVFYFRVTAPPQTPS